MWTISYQADKKFAGDESAYLVGRISQDQNALEEPLFIHNLVERRQCRLKALGIDLTKSDVLRDW